MLNDVWLEQEPEREVNRELGRELAHVRERAGLTQAELAGRLEVSQAVVSRTESGDRRLEDGELRRFAEALGSEEACAIEGRRARSWRVLPRPPLGHPDHDLLWEAEEVGRQLASHLSRPDTVQAFARRIEGLLEEIGGAAELLLKRACDIVFIGKVGVGKTSAICRIADLVVPRPGARSDAPVLDVAGGRTTLCEVQVTKGPTGIAIEPCTDGDVRAYVAEFADKVMHGLGDDGGPRGAEQEERGLASEVEKAIRNIAGLARRRGKDAAGIRRPDPARELAREILAEESGRGRGVEEANQRLQFEVLARMRTDRRERLDLRLDEDSRMDSLAWLKGEFHRINIGTNPEFTIPKRIRVSVDQRLIPGVAAVEGIEVRIVDTKGIDETVARADLESHFGSPHTVIVLCSGFNDAPATEAVELLKRAAAAGIDAAGVHGMLLGLPKFGEALQMRDDAGESAETVEEGYDMKAEVVDEVVHAQLGFDDFSVQFFNAHEDEAGVVRAQLGARVQAMFDGDRETMCQLVEGARTLLENFEDEQAQEIVRQAMTMVGSWVANNRDLQFAGRKIERSLVGEVNGAHPSTIHATMRRRGGWYNLDFSHHLAYGARLVVSAMLRRKIASFEEHCGTFLTVLENEPARPLLDQAQRAMARAYGNVAQRAQLLGETWFHDELEPDDPHWRQCIRRWGMGEGYVSDVTASNRGWFSAHPDANERLAGMVEHEWRKAMAAVEEMLEQE